MSTIVVVIIIVVIIAVLAIAYLVVRNRQSQQLQQQFGPEYQRTLDQAGGKREAESELRERRQRVESLSINPLTLEQRDSFGRRWQEVQAQFVDDPPAAIAAADGLVNEVMKARGYPMGDFDQRAADISVDHPSVVQNYRAAHDIALRQEAGEADTEDLRRAMVHYRALFNDLLETTGEGAPEGAPGDTQTETVPAQSTTQPDQTVTEPAEPEDAEVTH
jgi:type II secretory pathway pseudopilin PulG